MITPLVLAGICADLFSGTGKFNESWDWSGCHAGYVEVDGCSVIAFRGSKDAEDWLQDAEAFPLWDYRIGFVHAGFMNGMNDALSAVLAIGEAHPLVVTGHSLGGARARILAGLLAYLGKPVSQCCVFGSPRPGFANLSRILQKSGTPLASYKNCNDPVTEVPYLGGLYQHPDKAIQLEAHSAPDDLDPLRDHHLARYIEGLQKLDSARMAA